MSGLAIRNFANADALGDVFYNGGVPYDKNGALLVAAEMSGVLRRALLVGDSITAQAEVTLATATPYVVDNGDGTLTVTRTSHSAHVGEPVRITAAPSASLNLMDGEILSIVDANNIKCTIQGRTHGVTSVASASVAFPNRRSSRGWYSWLETLLGEMFSTTWCAVGGARIANLTTLVQDSDAGPHDVGFVCAGMNDIYADGNSLATLQADMTALLALVAARSQKVVLLSVPPRNSADASWSAGKQTIHTQFNRWLYEFAKANNLIFVNTWRATANATTYINSGATEPDPTASFSFDNTHPSSVGAYAVGLAVKTAIQDFLGVRGWSPSHVDDLGADAGNIFTNSNFATDTAGVPTSWAQSDTTASSTVGNSVAARTVAADGDALGKNAVITYNYGTATGTASTRFRRNNFHASVTAGDYCQLRVPFSVANAAGLLGIELCMFGTDADGTFWQVYGNNLDTNADPHTDTPISGVLMTPPAIIPAGLSDLDCWVRIYITSAQSSDVTVKLWHPVLRTWAA